MSLQTDSVSEYKTKDKKSLSVQCQQDSSAVQYLHQNQIERPMHWHSSMSKLAKTDSVTASQIQWCVSCWQLFLLLNDTSVIVPFLHTP